MDTIQKTIKAHCNRCRGHRNHLVLREETHRDFDDSNAPYVFEEVDTFRMLKCCGCDNITLQHESWFSQHTDDDGNPIVTVKYYPPAVSRHEPRWLLNLEFFAPPEQELVAEYLREIYQALHNDALRLAVMGVRAVIEQLMVSSVKDHGTFKKNLDNFEVQGYVSRQQRQILESVLDAGHATIHRGFKPSNEDVVAVIEIAEHLIASIYVHPQQAAKLKKRLATKKEEQPQKK